MATYKSMYNKSKSNRKSSYRDDQNRFKEEEEQKRYRQQQAIIESEYQKQLDKQNKRGGLDRVFDVMSTGGFVVNGALQDGWQGAKDGFKAGMDGFVPGDKEYGKEYAFEDTLGKATGGAWTDYKPDNFLGKSGKFTVNLLGEILTDPTSYLGGAGIIKSIGKGTGKRLGKEAMEEITPKMLKQAGLEKGINISDKQAQRHATKANKIMGNTITKGDVKLAVPFTNKGVEIAKSGDFFRSLGDKTMIAPAFNSVMDGVRNTGVLNPISTSKGYRKSLSGDMVDFVGAMNLKDKVIADKLAKMGYMGKKMHSANDVLKVLKDNPEMGKEVTAIMENPANYETVKYLEDVQNGDKMLQDFVSELTGKEYSQIIDSPVAGKIWESVMASENPIEKLAMPKNKFEKFIFKKQLDPENTFNTYEEAYQNFANQKNKYDVGMQEIASGSTLGDSKLSQILEEDKELIIERELNGMFKGISPTLKHVAVDEIATKSMIDDMSINGKIDGRKLRKAVNEGLFPDIATAKKEMVDLKAFDDIRNGKVTTTAVRDKMMQLDTESNPTLQTKDIYNTSIVDKETGEIIETTYDPYTGKVDEKPIGKAMLEELPQLTEPEMSKLDYLLNHAYTDKNLTTQLNDYLKSTGISDGVAGEYIVKEGKMYLEKMDRRMKSGLSIKPELVNSIQFLQREFRTMGASERANKKLSTMIEAYMPHMINKEMLNNPMILDKLKKQDPELYRTVFASAGNKFNPHGTERSKILQDKVKEILVDKRKKDGLDYNDITGKTIAEVNEALKPILKEVGFDGDFFLHNAYDAYVQRMITHGEVLYSDKTIDETLENFGKFVKPNAIQKKGTYYINQKNIRDVFKGMDETQQYKLLAEMRIEPDKSYNKMLLKLDGERMETLYKAVEKYGNPKNANIVAYELPDVIADMANNKGYTQQLDDTGTFLKVYDKFTNLWKQTATVINPGFHLRNKFSNTFQNYLAIGNDVFNAQTRDMTKQILKGMDGELKTKAGNTTSFQDIRNQLVARDIVNFKNFDVAKQGSHMNSMFGEELKGSGGLAEAIGRKLNLENPTALNKIDPTDTANFMPFVAGRNYGGGIEDFDRTLNFISNIKNDVDLDTAQEMVDKFLFDYSDLTQFESQVMKRMIPFYTWLRKNAPLQIEMMLEKPYLYGGVADMHRESQRGADTSNLPSHMKDWVRLPVKWNDEKDIYINPSMPYQDLEKLSGMNKADIIGMLNPAIKMPLEIMTNKNNYFDAPIYDEDDTFVEARDKIGKYVKNGTLGAYNTWEKALKALTSGDTEKAITGASSLATGVKVSTHDINKSKEDAIYRAIREMETQMEEDAKKGKSKFNAPFEEYKKTKLEKYGY